MSKHHVLHGISFLNCRLSALNSRISQLGIGECLDRAFEPMSRAPLGEEPTSQANDRDDPDTNGCIIQRLRVHRVQLWEQQNTEKERYVQCGDCGQWCRELAQVPFSWHKRLATHCLSCNDGEEVREIRRDRRGGSDGRKGNGRSAEASIVVLISDFGFENLPNDGSCYGNRDGANQQSGIDCHLSLGQLPEEPAERENMVSRNGVRDSLRRHET